MKPNTLILTYWIVHPEKDLSELFEMQQLGQNRVYEPRFEAGARHMLAMHARFDPADMNAQMSAFLYLMQNARRLCGALHEGASIFGHECWMNGKKLSFSEPIQ